MLYTAYAVYIIVEEHSVIHNAQNSGYAFIVNMRSLLQYINKIVYSQFINFNGSLNKRVNLIRNYYEYILNALVCS